MPWKEFQAPVDDERLIVRIIEQAEKNAPTVLFVHGLEGNHQASIIGGSGKILHEKGWRIAAIELRGSGKLNPGKKLYTAGDSDDLGSCIEWLNCQYPESPLHIVGLSLGANIVGKWAGESGLKASNHVHSAAMLSPPVDLLQCSEATKKSLLGIYDLAFLKDLKKRALRKMKQYRRKGWEIPVQIDDIASARTMMDFDDVFTSQMHGYRNVMDYYDSNSCGPLLNNISVPTLILTSKDDPLVPFDSFPHNTIAQNPSITMLATDHGGHLGWIAGSGLAPVPWADGVVAEWLVENHSAR